MARSEDKILEDIRDVECQLSPENLFCDGERPASEARRIEKRLTAELSKLYVELGRKPTMPELYPDLFEGRRNE